MPTTQKKLVFITRPIAPPWDEGSKNFALLLAKKIHIPNLHVFILTTPEKIKNLPKNVAQVPLYSNSRLTFGTKLKLFLFLLKTNTQMAHFIFVATPLTSLLLKCICKLRHLQTIQTIVSLRISSSFLLKQTIYGDRVVCLSKMSAKKIKNVRKFHVYTIPPGVDTTIFIPKEKENVIAFLGELYRTGSDVIIEELLQLLSKFLPSYKIVLGFRTTTTPPQERHLRAKLRIKIKNSRNKIIWHDVIDNMPAFLSTTKLVVFPVTNMSGKFDFPLVLIESLATGTPIVVSPIDPLIEFSQYKGVEMAPFNTAVSFMETIQKILYEKSYNSLSKSARETAVKHFSLEKVVKQYEKLYKDLIKS